MVAPPRDSHDASVGSRYAAAERCHDDDAMGWTAARMEDDARLDREKWGGRGRDGDGGGKRARGGGRASVAAVASKRAARGASDEGGEERRIWRR